MAVCCWFLCPQVTKTPPWWPAVPKHTKNSRARTARAARFHKHTAFAPFNAAYPPVAQMRRCALPLRAPLPAAAAAARRRRRGGGVGRRARRIGVLQAGVSGAGNGSSGGVLGMRGSDTRDNGSDRAGDAMATRRGCNGSNGRSACARRSWRSSTCATMCTWPNEWLQRVRQMGPPQPF